MDGSCYVLMMIYGWAWHDQQEPVEAIAIALPKHQWYEVCSPLAHGARTTQSPE